jgi:hypothetical protein
MPRKKGSKNKPNEEETPTEEITEVEKKEKTAPVKDTWAED